jgi:multiple sugar transport system permease protein
MKTQVRGESIGYKAFRTALLLFLIIVFLFPLYWMVRTSIIPRSYTLQYPPMYIPEHFDFSAYPRMFSDMNAGRVILNTIQVNIIAALLALALGIPAAYAVSRFRFWGKEDGFMFTALSTRFLPPATALVPIYFLYAKLHLTNNLAGLVIAYAGFNLPIVIWVMRSFIDEIPSAIEQSYILDGHTRLGAFFKIILPLSMPGIAAMFMICNFLTWGEFLVAAVLTTSVTAQTMPIAVAQLEGDIGILWQEITAFGVIATIPIVLIIVFFQRYLVRGFSLGVLK